jgi:hypothetical protein
VRSMSEFLSHSGSNSLPASGEQCGDVLADVAVLVMGAGSVSGLSRRGFGEV